MTYAWNHTPLVGPRSFVMSGHRHDQTSFGLVETSSGIVRGGWLACRRRSPLI